MSCGSARLVFAAPARGGAIGTGFYECAPSALPRPGAAGTRCFAWALLASAIGCMLLCVPYRQPRDPIEVVLIPAVVDLIGIGWVVLGASIRRGSTAAPDAPTVARTVIALVALLLVFQLVLRPGVRL